MKGIFDYLYKKEKENDICENKEFNAILNKELCDFFPERGYWKKSCYDQPQEVEFNNLPCHLRDTLWISKLIFRRLYARNVRIPVSYIKNFLDESEHFERARHNYELKIVRWQIEYMNAGGTNFLMPTGCDESSLIYGYDVDKVIRESIVKTLTKIGMDKDVIEEGIEKYSNMWRESYMNLSFDHQFKSPYCYKEVDEEHRQNWLKLREYEYYKEHKVSVDKYGTITPSMLMQENEVYELTETLDNQNAERIKYIEEHKSNNGSGYVM